MCAGLEIGIGGFFQGKKNDQVKLVHWVTVRR